RSQKSWIGVWAAPSGRAAELGYPTRPLLWPRCDHCCATTPGLLVCTLRYISPSCETAYLTASSCGLSFGFLTLSPLSVKSMQPYPDPFLLPFQPRNVWFTPNTFIRRGRRGEQAGDGVSRFTIHE